MIKSLKDQYSIKTNLNSTDFSYETLSVMYDKDPIDISILKNMISNPKDISNVYNILVTPNFNNGIDNVIYEIQLKCYWKINKDLIPPLYME